MKNKSPNKIHVNVKLLRTNVKLKLSIVSLTVKPAAAEKNNHCIKNRIKDMVDVNVQSILVSLFIAAGLDSKSWLSAMSHAMVKKPYCNYNLQSLVMIKGTTFTFSQSSYFPKH